MKKISLVGTGKVGSLTLQYLVEWKLGELYLINRDTKKSEGILLDTASAFPTDHDRLHVGAFDDLKTSDVVVITAGPTAKANQSFEELSVAGLEVIKSITGQTSFSTESIVILTTTPVDEAAEFFQKETHHPKEKVLGFGGSLDVARLKYLLSKATGKKTTDIEAYFLGIHGGRGLPIFREKVDDKESIIKRTKGYFSEVALKTGGSTALGPAHQLAYLVKAVVNDTQEPLGVSTWHPRWHMYVTWPATVGGSGVSKLEDVDLDSEEEKALNALLNDDKPRREELFGSIT